MYYINLLCNMSFCVTRVFEEIYTHIVFRFCNVSIPLKTSVLLCDFNLWPINVKLFGEKTLTFANVIYRPIFKFGYRNDFFADTEFDIAPQLWDITNKCITLVLEVDHWPFQVTLNIWHKGELWTQVSEIKSQYFPFIHNKAIK